MMSEEELNAQQLLQKAQRLKLRSHQILAKNLTGNTQTRIKGQGLEFADFREYQPGDEVRFIDWKTTARHQKVYVKTFEEERERQLVIVMDLSASMDYGSQFYSKREFAAHIAASIALYASQQKYALAWQFINSPYQSQADSSLEHQQFIPFSKSMNGIVNALNASLDKPSSTEKIPLTQYSKELSKRLRSSSFILWISDFYQHHPEEMSETFKHLKLKHDIALLQVLDPSELQLPTQQNLSLKNPLSDDYYQLQGNKNKRQALYQKNVEQHLKQLKAWCRKNAIGYELFNSDSSYIQGLTRIIGN